MKRSKPLKTPQKAVKLQKTGEDASEEGSQDDSAVPDTVPTQEDGLKYQATANAILEHLNKEFQEKKTHIAELTKQVADLKQVVAKSNKENEELRSKLKDKELENEELRIKLKNHVELDTNSYVKKQVRGGDEGLQDIAFDKVDEAYVRLGNEILESRKRLAEFSKGVSIKEEVSPNKKPKTETKEIRKLQQENASLLKKIILSKNENDEIRDKLRNKEVELTKLKEDLKYKEHLPLAEEQKGYKKLKEENASLEREIYKTKNINDALKSKLKEKQLALVKLNEDFKNMKHGRIESPAQDEEIRKLRQENASLSTEIMIAKNEIDIIEGKLNEKESALRKLNEDFSIKNQSSEDQEPHLDNKEIQKLKQENDSLLKEIIVTRNENHDVKEKLKGKEVELFEMGEELKNLSEQPKQQHEISALEMQVAFITNEKEELKGRLDRIEQGLQKLGVMCSLLKEEYGKIQNASMSLHPMEQRERELIETRRQIPEFDRVRISTIESALQMLSFEVVNRKDAIQKMKEACSELVFKGYQDLEFFLENLQ